MYVPDQREDMKLLRELEIFAKPETNSVIDNIYMLMATVYWNLQTFSIMTCVCDRLYLSVFFTVFVSIY